MTSPHPAEPALAGPLSLPLLVSLMRKMSHDLRGPLAAIIGTADLQATGGTDELTPKQVRANARIRRNAARALAILDDLMTYVKAQVGEYPLAAAPFDPRALLEKILAEVRSAADAQGLKCLVQVEDSTPARLVGDDAAVGRILAALLWNAVSFSRAGEIKVASTWHSLAGWSVLVQDAGPGIAPEVVAHLFEPFCRGEDRPQVPTSGCGLGLAMARSLARIMGGDLTLVETGPRGSLFRLRLPLH